MVVVPLLKVLFSQFLCRHYGLQCYLFFCVVEKIRAEEARVSFHFSVSVSLCVVLPFCWQLAICDIDILLCVNLASRGERNYVHESFFFFFATSQ